MKILFEVQRPNSDIRQYVDTLHSILSHKMDMISKLKSRVEEFAYALDEEEKISGQFKQMQVDERERQQRDDGDDDE